jgi:hypothetical protein
MPSRDDVGHRFIIQRSATKHGVTPDQIRHALRNVISISVTDDDLTMIVGHDGRSGLIEVGFIETTRRTTVLHAMPARREFLR